MAGSQLLLLALLLLFGGPCTGNFTLVNISSSQKNFTHDLSSPSSQETSTTDLSFSSSQETFTTDLVFPSSQENFTYDSSSPSSQETSTTDPSFTDHTAASTTPQTLTVSLSSSGFPSPELSPASQATTLTSGILGQAPGDRWIPTSHRNPGVVIAVCLFVSILLIGSVVIVVRHCRQDVSEFHKLDEVSMGNVSQRVSFANLTPE